VEASPVDPGDRVRLDRLFAQPPVLSRSERVAVHTQIERWLTDAIAAGRLRTGDRLPPERELSALLGVSRMTLRQGVEALERRGLVTRVPGRDGGAFISEPRVECDLTGLPGFSAQVRRTNLRPGAEVLEARRVRPPATVASALGIIGKAQAYRVVRVRSANDTPLAIERSWFPVRPLAGLLERDLTGSMYALLAEWGLSPETAVEHLEPTVADETDAGLLGIAVGTPLMRIERTAFSHGGVAVEYSLDLFRPDRVRIMVRSRVGEDLEAGRAMAFGPAVQAGRP
jgi:GntR family transcriptional regulator